MGTINTPIIQPTKMNYLNAFHLAVCGEEHFLININETPYSILIANYIIIIYYFAKG